MTTETAIHILELYNKWRRADEDMEMPDPKQLGLAIDCSIDTLKQSKQSKKLIIDLQKQNHSLRVQLSDIKDNSCKF